MKKKRKKYEGGFIFVDFIFDMCSKKNGLRLVSCEGWFTKKMIVEGTPAKIKMLDKAIDDFGSPLSYL